MRFLTLLTLGQVVLAQVALAQNKPPAMNVRVCGPDELYCAAVDSSNRVKVDATFGSPPSVNQGTQGSSTSPWYTNLRSAGGTEIGTAANPIRSDPTGTTAQPVSALGVVSTANSSTALLGIGGVFTGTAVDTLNYGVVSINTFANVASATNGVSVQWSSDASNWDSTDTFTALAATGKAFTFGPAARYLRVVYTNGAVAQGAFRLQTILRPTPVKPSSHRIDEVVPAESDSELVSAVLRTKDPATGNYLSTSNTNPVPVRATLRAGAVYGAITVGTTGSEAKVGASRLTGRRFVVVTPIDSEMYWCIEPTCANCTIANGMPMYRRQTNRWAIDDTASLCVVASTAAKTARMMEGP